MTEFVTPAEVRAAKAFLRSFAKAGVNDIPPRKFAQAAKELSVGFRELLRLLARTVVDLPRTKESAE